MAAQGYFDITATNMSNVVLDDNQYILQGDIHKTDPDLEQFNHIEDWLVDQYCPKIQVIVRGHVHASTPDEIASIWDIFVEFLFMSRALGGKSESDLRK